jgi:fatty-acyl-CoA synthase
MDTNLRSTDEGLTSGQNHSEVKAWLRALAMTKQIFEHRARLLSDLIEELADKAGDAPALISDRESLSFRALGERSNRYARWALAQGLGKGETVALLMPNRPEYMAIWIGITHVGGVVALLNTNLAGPALGHCINIVRPEHIIVADELINAFDSARPHLAGHAKVWLHGEGATELPNIAHEIEHRSGDKLAPSARPTLTIFDKALYIYTSGTTGLPKAAKVDHRRLLTWCSWFAGMMDTRPTDRMYNCLPMYHSIGGAVATGAVLLNGGSVVVREKFSASEFWDDVVRFDCTLFQYIGELCRYLARGKPHPLQRSHRLRLCCGNGLRADIWGEFQTRFKIPRILEFYAATEGNVTMFNVEGKPGSIGRIPAFLAHRSRTALVRFDVEHSELVRNERGFCMRCRTGEVGEAIGRILDAEADHGASFEGYINEADSEKKILRDVFKKGDAWFRTGDLMRKDEHGYFYFVDRIGDTFRWKGENVSTAEVAEAIAAFPGITQASVYGVFIPGTEGRAGMAAIVSEKFPDLTALQEHLAARLPGYARPLFVRLCGEMALTSTFKYQKHELVREGYDPAATPDPIYFCDPRRQAFVALDQALYEHIVSGQIRL